MGSRQARCTSVLHNELAATIGIVCARWQVTGVSISLEGFSDSQNTNQQQQLLAVVSLRKEIELVSSPTRRALQVVVPEALCT